MGANGSKATSAGPTPTQFHVIKNAVEVHTRSGWEPTKLTRRDGQVIKGESLSVPDYTNHKALRVTSDIDAPLSTVVGLLTDISTVNQYDPDADRYEKLPPLTDAVAKCDSGSEERLCSRIRLVLKPFSKLLNSRDFCCFFADSYVPVGAVVDDSTKFACSDNDVRIKEMVMDTLPDHPTAYYVSNLSDAATTSDVPKGFVRGTCHLYSFIAVPGLDDTVTRLSCIMCFDANGVIPNSVLDGAFPQLDHMMQNIEKLCVERKAGSSGKATNKL